MFQCFGFYKETYGVYRKGQGKTVIMQVGEDKYVTKSWMRVYPLPDGDFSRRKYVRGDLEEFKRKVYSDFYNMKRRYMGERFHKRVFSELLKCADLSFTWDSKGALIIYGNKQEWFYIPGGGLVELHLVMKSAPLGQWYEQWRSVAYEKVKSNRLIRPPNYAYTRKPVSEDTMRQVHEFRAARKAAKRARRETYKDM